MGYNGDLTVNAGGEYIDRKPETIAREVMSGTRWIDYGGYPMFYLNRHRNVIGPKGFVRFLNRIRVFSTSPEKVHFWSFRKDFKYPRSLVAEKNVNLPPWATFLSEDARRFIFRIPKGIYEMFKLEAGSGEYYYAYANVDAEKYAKYIQETTTANKIAPRTIVNGILSLPKQVMRI